METPPQYLLYTGVKLCCTVIPHVEEEDIRAQVRRTEGAGRNERRGGGGRGGCRRREMELFINSITDNTHDIRIRGETCDLCIHSRISTSVNII